METLHAVFLLFTHKMHARFNFVCVVVLQERRRRCVLCVVLQECWRLLEQVKERICWSIVSLMLSFDFGPLYG
jgi:hypothetical protein